MLQLIAMITMLIDHIGFIFFPGVDVFRIIGRIAFPLYSWFLVQGYLHTKNIKKYMWRLFYLACISQVPYTLALKSWEFNVIFTLLLALFGLYAMDHIKDEGSKSLILIGVLGASLLIPMDYGMYGVLLVLIYRYFSSWKMVAGHLFLNLLYAMAFGGLQLFSILGTALLFISPAVFRSIPVHKWIYRSFYPAHLLLLLLLYLWINP